jgi:flagellar L-ring protein precursor FlgH
MNKPSSSRCDSLKLLVLAGALAAGATHADSLWKKDISKPLTADRRARAVGDILTILVEENSSSTKDNTTSTAKKSGLDASIASFLYAPAASGLLTKGGKLPAIKMDSSSSFDGGGRVANAEKITGRIAVTVVDVLPNGNLVVEGTRRTKFANESLDAVLRGTVRGEDVTAANTVFSYNVADANIRYISKGTVSDSQKKGWFNRAWDKVTPF